MTYDIGVWNPRTPLNPQQVGEVYARLCQGDHSDSESSDRVAAFVKELTERYPQIDDVPEEQVDDCPWSIAFDVSPGHVIMSMSFSRVEDVAPFVYELARKHRLLLYNPQENTFQMPE